MRHLGSLAASVVIGVVAWILIGWAQAKLGVSASGWSAYALPLLLMAIGGLLIGLVAATRVSPFGPFVAGGGYVLLQLAYVTWPGFLNWLPDSVFGQHDIWTRPAATGLAAVLGLVMLTAILSIRRWQRWPSTGRHAAGTEPVEPADVEPLPGTSDYPLSGPRAASSSADADADATTRREPDRPGTPT